MSHLAPITTPPAPREDPAASAVAAIAGKPSTHIPAAVRQVVPTTSALTLSFAFDSIEKKLNVVIRDERSGEVVRTIEYKNIPANLHSNDKLHGLLLNQFA
jgi:hypothetical protein